MLRYLALAVALGSLAAPPEQPPILVSAAVSLSDVLQQLGPAFQKQSGARVMVNLGASNTLARQIAAGAKVDVFISADMAQMDVVHDHIDASSRVVLIANQLAIAVPGDRLRRMTSARDLADPSIRRVALGDPDAVPAGVYAKEYLQKIGIWDVVARKVIPSASVRLALAAVENGGADAAVVYKTDIPTASRVREAFVVPVAEGPRIVYPAAIVRGAPNVAGARRFMRFLQSAEASAVFQRAGFVRP